MSPRPSFFRRTTLVALVLVAGLPLAACGGGDNTESWVGTFCGAGSGVRTVLSSQNDALRAQLQITDLPPAELKQSIVRGAGSIVAASATAGTRIRDAGEPSVDQGEEIQAAAVAKYAAIDARLKALEVEANALDSSSRTTLADGIGPYSQHVADASRDVAGSFQELKQFEGFAELDEVSRTPNDTQLPETCSKLQTVAS